jgi:penicillin-binding protein 1C
MFPPDGARIELSERDGAPEPVALKVSGGTAPLTVLVNGLPLARQSGRVLFFDPGGPGFVRVTVMDAKGTADSVMVRLQ